MFLAISGCTAPADQSATPGDSYALSPSEIAVLEQRALAGEATATDRLIQFYTLTAPDLSKATQWQRVAAKHGNPGQMINLATSLGIAGGSSNCNEAASWLQRVKAATSDARLIQRAEAKLKLLQADGQCAQRLRPVSPRTSNNSFKPNPLRGSA